MDEDSRINQVEVVSSPEQVFYFTELLSNWKGITLDNLFELIECGKLKPYELINAAFNPNDKKVYATIKQGNFFFWKNVKYPNDPDYLRIFFNLPATSFRSMHPLMIPLRLSKSICTKSGSGFKVSNPFCFP